MKLLPGKQQSSRRVQAGFSLIELLVATAILLIMMAGVFQQIARVQNYTNVQEMKRDMMANARQVVDQFDRELRLAGYPNVRQFCITGCTGTTPLINIPENDHRVAVRSLVFASPTQVMFEGDIEGDGTVQSIMYSYTNAAPAGSVASCNPGCLLRGAVPKVDGAPSGQATPANQSVVLENVALPPGNAGIFTFYTNSGTVFNPGAGVTYTAGAGNVAGSISDIRMVKMTFNAQTETIDVQNKSRPMASISIISHMNNHY